MSKRKERAASGQNGRKPGRPGRALIILLVLIAVIAAFGVVSMRRSVSNLPGGMAANPLPMPSPPSLPATGPAREYVYAGGSLVSTIEPFRDVPDDLGVWRPSSGVWYIVNGGRGGFQYTWGTSTDLPAPGIMVRLRRLSRGLAQQNNGNSVSVTMRWAG